MHEKADLREANLNGAILADAKLGGAPRRGILLRHLHRAASDIVTTSDVTPSHRERLSTPTDVTA